MFYANLIWFGVITVVGITLLRTWNQRELMLSILGLFTPHILTFGLYYVAGRNPFDFLHVMGYNLFGLKADFAFIPIIIAAIIYTGILVFGSLSHLFLMLGTKKVQSRKTFSLLLWVFLISVLIWFLVPSVSIEIIWIAAIPLSYFLSHYFTFLKRKLVPEILFTLFFLMIVVMQIWYLR